MSASLQFEGWTVVLDGRCVLDAVCARLTSERPWVVLGRSGAGKTVWMKSAAGLLPVEAGELRLTTKLGTWLLTASDVASDPSLRRHMTYVHQDPALLDDLTVAENIQFAWQRRRSGAGPRSDPSAALLERFALNEVADQKPATLTLGQARRVALCRALSLQPQVLVLDEPTTGLDPIAAREVDAALVEVAAMGTLLIVITHDLRSIDALSPQIAFLDDHRLAFVGSYDAARRDGPPSLQALLAARAYPPSDVERARP